MNKITYEDIGKELFNAIDQFNTQSYEEIIKNVYKPLNRNIIEASGHLQCESSELAELLLKEKWYGKSFTKEDLLSEAGDILNFLTYILISYDLTLNQAMENNKTKLKERGWL